MIGVTHLLLALLFEGPELFDDVEELLGSIKDQDGFEQKAAAALSAAENIANDIRKVIGGKPQ